uniref:uncharacterized protein LOC103787805 n=1 Tax=Callithrix jacchus TaxID=9483 RepID=UPI00083F97A4|nr:uncharacterized protein LOC103787805 [Callithrix jacchus]
MAPSQCCPSTGCWRLGQAWAAAPHILPGRRLSGHTLASSSLSRLASLLLFWWWVWGPGPPATATSAILPHPRASFKNSRWAGPSCSGRLCPPSPGSQCQMRAGDKSSIFLVLRGWQWGLPLAPHGSWQPCPLCQQGPLDRRTAAAGDQGAHRPAARAGTRQPAGGRDLPSSPARVMGQARGCHFHFLALEKAPPSSGTSEPSIFREGCPAKNCRENAGAKPICFRDSKLQALEITIKMNVYHFTVAASSIMVGTNAWGSINSHGLLLPAWPCQFVRRPHYYYFILIFDGTRTGIGKTTRTIHGSSQQTHRQARPGRPPGGRTSHLETEPLLCCPASLMFPCPQFRDLVLSPFHFSFGKKKRKRKQAPFGLSSA